MYIHLSLTCKAELQGTKPESSGELNEQRFLLSSGHECTIDVGVKCGQAAADQTP